MLNTYKLLAIQSRNMETTFSSSHTLVFDLLKSSPQFCTLRILFTLMTTSAHSTDSNDVSFKTCSSCSSRHSQTVSTWDTWGSTEKAILTTKIMVMRNNYNCPESTQGVFLIKEYSRLISHNKIADGKNKFKSK